MLFIQFTYNIIFKYVFINFCFQFEEFYLTYNKNYNFKLMITYKVNASFSDSTQCWILFLLKRTKILWIKCSEDKTGGYESLENWFCVPYTLTFESIMNQRLKLTRRSKIWRMKTHSFKPVSPAWRFTVLV